MASLTQMVVGKGIPNQLIAESLLKILRELISLIPTKMSYHFSSMEWQDHKLYLFPQQNDYKFTLSC